MHLNEKEKTFLFRKLFGANLTDLDDKTQRKILKGQHDFKGKVGRELFKGMEREEEFHDHLQHEAEALNALFQDSDQISTITLNNHLVDQFTKGFLIGAQGNGADEFLKAMNQLKHLESQSIAAGKVFREQDIEGLSKIIETTRLPEEFWLGVSARKIIENERSAYPLIFKGYLYTLAIVEAYILSSYEEITESQIVFGLLERNNYFSSELLPLQRFFTMVFYDGDKPLSINQIAEWIGERTKPESDPSSWVRSFRRNLDGSSLFSMGEADNILQQILKQKPDYPDDLYWLLFLTARALQILWIAYEQKKDTEPLWQEIMPNGPSAFCEFYRIAYSHASKVVRG